MIVGIHRQGGAWTLKGPYCKEIGCPLCCSSSESTLRRRERDHRYGYIYPERRTLLTSSFPFPFFYFSLCTGPCLLVCARRPTRERCRHRRYRLRLRPCLTMALAVAPRSGQSSAGQAALDYANYAPAHNYSTQYASYTAAGPSSSSSTSNSFVAMPREPIHKAHHAQHPGPYPMSYPPSNQAMPPPPMHHLPPAQQQQQMNNGYVQQQQQNGQNGNGQNGTGAGADSAHASPLASPAAHTQPLASAASSPESMSPQSPQAPHQPQANGTPTTGSAGGAGSGGGAGGGGSSKKKHICPTCERAFTTSGHLARHTRVHTGERNHKCPFPGCETRCSRQDNLQQQYVPYLSYLYVCLYLRPKPNPFFSILTQLPHPPLPRLAPLQLVCNARSHPARHDRARRAHEPAVPRQRSRRARRRPGPAPAPA